jgi:hypothetical protein
LGMMSSPVKVYVLSPNFSVIDTKARPQLFGAMTKCR